MSRHRPRTWRVFVATFGEGPWTCNGCGCALERIGREFGDGNIHHRDENPSNDDPGNLVPLCQSCHRRVHENPLVREKITSKLRGRSRSEAAKRTSSESLRRGYANGRPPVKSMLGKKHSLETRAKMSAAAKARRKRIDV